MREIGNIYLCWRKGKGGTRIPIGTIKNSVTQGARFQYLPDGLKIAKTFGFNSYEGFPDLNKIYNENVLEIFGQRLVRSERSDIQSFYDFWGINSKFKEDDFYMLAYTQGLLPTDNFEFLADFNPTPTLSFVSEITNLTEAKLSSELIKIGDLLRYELEPENIYDSFAVKVYFGNFYLGHIKLIHSKVFHKTTKTLIIKVHNIEKTDILNRVFVKVIGYK